MRCFSWRGGIFMDKREPDFETESMKVWIPTKEEEAQEPKIREEDIINYRGEKIIVNGFNKVFNDKQEVIFIWKFKHEKEQVLYYFSENLSEKDKATLKEVMNMLRSLCQKAGYDLLDLKEFLENVINEIPTLNNLAKIKKKERRK